MNIENKNQIDSENCYDKVYIDVKSEGVVYRHRLADTNLEDYPTIWEVAVDKAKLGQIVYILPILPENHPLYSIVFEGAKEKKCPDLKVDGSFIEIKKPIDELTENKISKCIQNCHKQADSIVILLSTYSYCELKKIIKGRFKTHLDLKVIEIKMDGKYYTFTRNSD